MIIGNEIDGTMYVSLAGELDDRTAPEMRRQLDEIIERARFIKIVFDLSRLEFMDSTGIGVLLGRYKNCREKAFRHLSQSPKRAWTKCLRFPEYTNLCPNYRRSEIWTIIWN